MLGKLIKHEWKSVYKVGSILLLAMLAVTAIGCVVLQMPWLKDLFTEESNLGEVQTVILTFTLMISFILYIFLLVGITYGIMIYLGVHFYKTMYTEQGYLTNTLPVTPHQLLISKTLVSGIWYVLIEVAVIISVVALIFSFVAGLGTTEGYTLAEALETVWSELVLVFESEFKGTMIHFLIYMVITMLVSPFAAMLMIFGALTIGQLSRKHKAAMGILAYFGICIVNMIISMIVSMIYTVKISLTSINNPAAVNGMDMMGIYDASLIIVIVMAVALYWISHYILSKKLNME